jgi:hypothetical protein
MSEPISGGAPGQMKGNVLVLGESYVPPECADDFAWIWLGKAEDTRAKWIRWLDEVPLTFPAVFDVDEYRPHTEAILGRCEALQRAHGTFAAVVAHTEQTLQIGAEIRRFLGIEGATPDAVRRVRNKLAMRDAAVHDPLIAMPRYAGGACLAVPARLDWFLARANQGVVVKPTSQAGSQGVSIHFDRTALLDDIQHRLRTREDFIVEERIDGRIHHVDGLVVDGRPLVLNVAAYVDDCLSWQSGGPMSSCDVADIKLRERLVRQTERVVRALAMDATTFHMEFIVTKEGQPYFLEVGGRPGGAGIAQAVAASRGVDLWAEAFGFDLGIRRHINVAEPSGYGGWIVMPTGAQADVLAREVRGAESLPPSVYRSEMPLSGQLLRRGGVGGKFWLRTDSADEVEKDIKTIAEIYSVEFDPFPGHAGERLAASDA